MSDPLVSILIPTYNREKEIAVSIRSALSQDYPEVEVIVVDNCSTDNTFKAAEGIAAESSRCKVYQNDENLGPVRNWVACLEKAKGRYVKILWSDDWIDSSFLSTTVPLLENDQSLGFVMTPTAIHTGSKVNTLFTRHRGEKVPLEEFVDFFARGWLGYPSSPGNALFRIEDIKDNLLVDIPNDLGLDFKIFGAGNDVLLFLKCFPKYSHFAVTNETLSHFSNHGGSLTAANDLSLYYNYAVKFYLDGLEGKDELKARFQQMIRVRNIISRGKFSALRDENYLLRNGSTLPVTAMAMLWSFARQVFSWYFIR